MNFFAEKASFQAHLEGKRESDLRSKDRWTVDHYRFPHPNSPEKHTLESVLGPRVSLQSLAETRRMHGKPTHMLELFGSADFLDNPQIADSLTGARLLDPVYDERERTTEQRLPHHAVVLGDIHLPETRDRVSENFTSRGIPAIDIAVCAPLYGWGDWFEGDYHPSVILDTYYPILQWTFSKLNSDQGQLITDFPPRMGLRGTHMRSWEERMNEAGIETTVVEGKRSYAASIVKQPHSPSEVVPLLGRCLPPHLR